MKLQDILETKIQELRPTFMKLVNESHLHEKHIPGHHEESHFYLVLVSHQFVNLNRIQRQRLVYGLILDEFKNRLHSIRMELYTPEEYKS